MADYTTTQNSNSGSWIIGGIVVVLILLFILFASSGPVPGIDPETVPGPDGTPLVEPAQPIAPATAD